MKTISGLFIRESSFPILLLLSEAYVSYCIAMQLLAPPKLQHYWVTASRIMCSALLFDVLNSTLKAPREIKSLFGNAFESIFSKKIFFKIFFLSF
jgi:hypothetical protein